MKCPWNDQNTFKPGKNLLNQGSLCLRLQIDWMDFNQGPGRAELFSVELKSMCMVLPQILWWFIITAEVVWLCRVHNLEVKYCWLLQMISPNPVRGRTIMLSWKIFSRCSVKLMNSSLIIFILLYHSMNIQSISDVLLHNALNDTRWAGCSVIGHRTLCNTSMIMLDTRETSKQRTCYSPVVLSTFAVAFFSRFLDFGTFNPGCHVCIVCIQSCLFLCL